MYSSLKLIYVFVSVCIFCFIYIYIYTNIYIHTYVSVSLLSTIKNTEDFFLVGGLQQSKKITDIDFKCQLIIFLIFELMKASYVLN